MTSLPVSILAGQQADGGWGYGRDAWTEPTALAVLALSTASEEHGPAVRSGIEWLRRVRRNDGGWPPNPGVDQSVTWATSLALLTLSATTGEAWESSVKWLLDTSGKETELTFRFVRFFAGANPDRQGFEGWPWYPGTAAWVAPTGVAIRALVRARGAQSSSVARRIGERVEAGRSFLLARRCRDGGWNHGASRALGYEADSYPETTGVALLGLTGGSPAALQPSLRRAAEELAQCRSAQGRAWLRLALASHSCAIPPVVADDPASRDVTDLALNVLAGAAERGRNVFA